MPDGLDPSLILGPAQAAGQNGFGNALLGAAQAGSALYNFQKQGADLAAGQDFQKAIGPDGQLSVPAFNKLLAADPRASLAAVDSSQAGQTNQATALSNQQAEIANTAARISYIGNLFTGYTENAPTMKGFQSDIADGIRQGIIDPQTGAQILATSPDPSSPEFASFAKAEAQHLSAAAGQIARFLPQPTTVGSGAVQPVVEGNQLLPGALQPGSTITSGPSGEFLNSPTTLTMPDGSSFTGTPAQVLAKLGVSVSGGTVTPPAGPQQGYGRAGLTPIGPQPATGASAAPPPQPSPAAAQSGGGIVVPAGATAAATQLATDQMNAFSQDVQTATNSAPTISSIQDLAAAARGFTPGPLSSNMAEANSLFAELGLPAAGDAAAAEQTAAKAAGVIMASNLTPFGAPTNEKLVAALGITPNGSMSAGGLAATAALTAGQKLYQLKLGQAAQQWKTQGGTPSDANNGYNAFKLQFENETSPAVLALQYMPVQQQKEFVAYVKTLRPDQQAAIDKMVANTYGTGGGNAPAGQ